MNRINFPDLNRTKNSFQFFTWQTISTITGRNQMNEFVMNSASLANYVKILHVFFKECQCILPILNCSSRKTRNPNIRELAQNILSPGSKMTQPIISTPQVALPYFAPTQSSTCRQGGSMSFDDLARIQYYARIFQLMIALSVNL